MNEPKTSIKDFLFRHTRILMPLILLICVVITVISAVSINRKEALEREMAAAAEDAANNTEEPVTVDTDIIATPQYELLKITADDAEYADIYNMIVSYYHARVSGDLLTAGAINPFLNDVEKIRFEEYSNYLEDYPSIEVYLKPGLTTGSYVAYICAETKFTDLDVTLPGMQTYYIGLNEDGTYYMADSTYDEAVYDYIMKLTLQDDVIELNNKVSVPYNELVETNEEVGEYMAYLREKVKEDVGEKLAELETGESIADVAAAQADAAASDADAQSTPAPTEITVIKKVKATDVVNIRKSDSEQADKLDKASVGQEFTLIEQKPNGWSEIEYKGASAFIKSDYLEASETEVVPADSVNTDNGEDTGNTEDNDNADDTDENGTDTANAATPSPSASPSPSPAPAKGKVKVTDSGVRIRKEPSTDSDILTTVYAGEQLDLIESLSSGWSKVKIKDVTGYTKSEFLKEVK